MDNEIIGALPTGGQASSPLLRNFLIKRMIYSFEPTDDTSTFNALDDDTGSLPQVLAFNGSFFWLDPDDTTSDHDGVAVIATADGYRYKVDEVDYRIRSALSDTETEPPESPSLGDVYLVPAGATGAWSSHQDDIAIWTRNGWRFEVPVIGKWLLIEDVGGFKGYYSDGWSYGPGARSFDDESVPLSASLGWGERVIVENQTTTTPPTATKGLRYIVGASAEGDWLGKDGQIAVCEVAGTWTFYAPSNGWAAYDKSTNAELTFDGTAWTSAAGAWVGFKSVFTQSVTLSSIAGSTAYSYSASTAPTTSNRVKSEGTVLSYAAKKAGAKLRFHHASDIAISVAGTASAAAGSLVIGLFRNSETSAIAWKRVGMFESLVRTTGAASAGQEDSWFEVTAADADSNDYYIGYTNPAASTNGINVSTVERSIFSVEEGA